MSPLLIAVVFGAIAAGAAIVALRPRASSGKAKSIPPAMRPAAIDTVLESDRLTKVTLWGMTLAIFFAIFLPVYWYREPARMAAKEKSFADESIERGHIYYALTTDPVSGEPNLRGKECARCHGVDAEGGTTMFLSPATGVSTEYPVPELKTVFSRYQKPPAGFRDAREFIRETIERGRPGTPMPTWGNEYGGPLTEQEIDDIVNWLQEIQEVPQVQEGAAGDQIFNQLCVACHGIGGSGGSGPAMRNGATTAQFPDIEDHIAFVKEGSVTGQPYGTSGTGTGTMPAWGGTLTDEQIRAVVEYERSL
ncbi:MAG: c-type cytochrome [Actinomycetota bacterium]